MKAEAVCPCRVREAQEKTYGNCCGVWHTGFAKQPAEHAQTPEQLMRSRYSAYALAQKNDAHGQGLLRYLLGTWHVATRPDDMELQPMQWIGLELIEAAQTDTAGIVEFVAWHKVNGKATRMHERSRFIRAQGRWFYLDGKEDDPAKFLP